MAVFTGRSDPSGILAGLRRFTGSHKAAATQPRTVALPHPPASIDEAIEMNPALAEDLACRDEQAKFSMDYNLRLIDGIRECLAGRTRSTGRIEFMLHFDNDPETRRGVGTAVEPLSSELAPEDDLIVLECVKAFHIGSVLMSSEKYGGGDKRYKPTNINLPLEDSYIFKMVREGSYTAGTNFGCEVP